MERVRSEGRALMSKSIFSCDAQVTVSFIDEHSPRAIIQQSCPVLKRSDQGNARGLVALG